MKYHRQKTEYTCGIACMQMLTGLSERKLMKLLKPTKKRGTENKAFTETAKKLKLSYVVRRNSNWETLKRLHKRYKIIVCYWIEEEKTGHYAVVKTVGKDIVLMDPYYGPNFKLSKQKFMKKWYGLEEKRWLFGLHQKSQ